MRDFLAEKLLVKIMDWSAEEISTERPLLQALASFKYNDYQQYTAGIRFFESLVRWLYQFVEISERATAYAFLKKNLIFISSEQMTHLIDISYNEVINPILVDKTAKELKIPKYHIGKIQNSTLYKINLRRSLFVGLSDGSKIDILRRMSGLNNEQVTTTHEISAGKSDSMLDELQKDTDLNQKFHTIFLIDDFTASGKSYFRAAEKKGKVYDFLDKIYIKNEKIWDHLIDKNNLEIHIIFYIATREAIEMLTEEIGNWMISNSIQNLIKIYGLQILERSIKESILQNADFMNLIQKYFDNAIIDRHYSKGKHDNPFLGFNEGSLPLVLHHNTPNNSLPILWFPEDRKVVGLFPRISRHKE
jgi:hypothetical protein